MNVLEFETISLFANRQNNVQNVTIFPHRNDSHRSYKPF